MAGGTSPARGERPRHPREAKTPQAVPASCMPLRFGTCSTRAAPWPRGGLGGSAVWAGPGAELRQPGAVGVGLAFGPLGAGPQVGAHLLTFAGGLSAPLGQHLLRVGARPARLRAGGF